MNKRLLSAGLVALYVAIFVVANLAIVAPISAQGKKPANNNALEGMAKECNNIKPATDWCSVYYETLDEQFDCGKENDFYEIRDGKQFIKVDTYNACVKKVRASVEKVTGDYCSYVQRDNKNGPDGKSGRDIWNECEKEQRKLFLALGCAQAMFKQLGNSGQWSPKEKEAGECNAKINASAISDIGKLSTTDDKEEAEPDCDTKANSVLSWIACPLIDMGVAFTDWVFEDFVKPMLENVPVSTESTHSSFKAWQQFRLLANILLIGSLMVVVYSQAKGDK